MCQLHDRRTQKGGNPLHLGYLKGVDNPAWKGDEVGYGSAHERVRRAKGSASHWICTDCGTMANQWSYDHADPAESLDRRGIPYSGDPNHYEPRCTPCHKRFDLSQAELRRLERLADSGITEMRG